MSTSSCLLFLFAVAYLCVRPCHGFLGGKLNTVPRFLRSGRHSSMSIPSWIDRFFDRFFPRKQGFIDESKLRSILAENNVPLLASIADVNGTMVREFFKVSANSGLTVETTVRGAVASKYGSKMSESLNAVSILQLLELIEYRK